VYKNAGTFGGKNMPNPRQNPFGDSARESLIVTIILRTGFILLGSFISVLLFVLAHALTTYIFGKTELFDEYSSEYLLLSIACGGGVGLFLPFESLGRIFELLINALTARRQAVALRAAIFLVGFLTFIILYWYFLTIAIAIGAAVMDLL
jgi:hypothetical protein